MTSGYPPASSRVRRGAGSCRLQTVREPAATGIAGRSGNVVLIIGTTKWAFLLHSDARRASWEMQGPHFTGEEVYALALDQRSGRRTLWAVPSSPCGA